MFHINNTAVLEVLYFQMCAAKALNVKKIVSYKNIQTYIEEKFQLSYKYDSGRRWQYY